MNLILLSSALSEKTVNRISELTGCKALTLPGYDVLPEPVRSHPDMLVFSHGDTVVTDRGYYSENKELLDEISAGKRIVLSTLGGEYPDDVAFNAFEINGTLFGRLASLSDAVAGMFDKKINVNQGYAKCSTAVLPDGSVVTADAGIYKAVSDEGIDALVISPGGIDLPGYDTGFIGGASFAYGDKLYLFGSVEALPDHSEILAFAGKHNCAVVSLSDGGLCDHGGAVIL